MVFVKGQSGNPKGRPRNPAALAPTIHRLLREKDADGHSNKELIAHALINRAKAGEIDAIKVVLDRADGKVREAITLEQTGTFDIILRWNDGRDAPEV